jgi:hypothetical protein
MFSRRLVFAVFLLFVWPVLSFAGPIEFDLTPTNLFVLPGTPAISTALTPFLPPSMAYTFDPATHAPTNVEVVAYDPTLLPKPAPIDIHPDGTTHWNNDGYFNVDVRLTDVASGEHVDLSFGGRAHMYNIYGNGQWAGTTYYWFMDTASFTLGGNDYTVWGTNWYDTGPVSLDVWVGANPPLHLTPEPGALLLAGLGLLPLGIRAMRRR